MTKKKPCCPYWRTSKMSARPAQFSKKNGSPSRELELPNGTEPTEQKGESVTKKDRSCDTSNLDN